MNFNCIIKTGLVAVAAMVSLSSFSQDLIARQAPIDKKLKSVDSLALQKQIRAEQSEYPALSLYPNWNNQYAHSYGNAIIPETYTIDLTGFRMPTPSTKITSPFGPRWRRMHNGLDLKVNIGDTIVKANSIAAPGPIPIMMFPSRTTCAFTHSAPSRYCSKLG